MAKNQLSNGTAFSEHLVASGIQGVESLQRLSSPPRRLSGLMWLRLMFLQFNSSIGFACCFGTMAIFVGLAFVLLSGSVLLSDSDMGSIETQYPWLPSAIGAGVLFLGVSVWCGIAYTLIARSRCVMAGLMWGEPLEGYISQMMDRGVGKYRPYAEVLKEMTKFRGNFGSTGTVLSLIRHSLTKWPVKIMIKDSQGEQEEIATHMDVGPRLTNGVDDPRVLLLVDRRQSHTRCVALEQFPWLNISDSGNFGYAIARDAEKIGFGWALFRALQVVVPTYCLSVIGLAFGNAPRFVGDGGFGMPIFVGLLIVPMFTFTHGVVPVFFYRLFTGVLESFSAAMETGHGKQLSSKNLLRFMYGFVHLNMFFWYGVPIVALAALTGWLSLGWGVLHVLLAGTGRRRWVFLEHGSTSMALLLFVVFFSGENIFPVGVMVVLFQALLLTLVEWKGKALWVKSPADVAEP